MPDFQFSTVLGCPLPGQAMLQRHVDGYSLYRAWSIDLPVVDVGDNVEKPPSAHVGAVAWTASIQSLSFLLLLFSV